jgi:hypothetical protein
VIEELGIRDLGVIAEATLPLGPGFTAVTGETGAGKTMVVTALGLLLGARADAATVRAGAKQAWVEGRWLLDDVAPVAERVADAGGDLDGGELLLGRSVSAEGRSRAIVGGRSAPVGVLAELGCDPPRRSARRSTGSRERNWRRRSTSTGPRIAPGAPKPTSCATSGSSTTPAPARRRNSASRSTRSRRPTRSPVRTSRWPSGRSGSPTWKTSASPQPRRAS